MNPRFLIVLSRAHAEELLPQAAEHILERIERQVSAFGVVIIELGPHGTHRLLIAENGVQISNRIARA